VPTSDAGGQQAAAPACNIFEGGAGQRTDRVGGGARVVLHVDMDCFFVSVLVRGRPGLISKPLAVAHGSGGDSSSAEISSCNYVARAQGVKAGMWCHAAKQRCPDLQVIAYDFAQYEEVSKAVLKILHRSSPLFQPMSCDEGYLEFPADTDGAAVAARLRAAILVRYSQPNTAFTTLVSHPNLSTSRTLHIAGGDRWLHRQRGRRA